MSLTFICATFLCSCEMLEYHPYDVDISGERGVTYKNIDLIETATAGHTSIRFAMISDTQGYYDETLDAVMDINRQNVDFVVHGGDLSDYGMAREFITNATYSIN